MKTITRRSMVVVASAVVALGGLTACNNTPTPPTTNVQTTDTTTTTTTDTATTDTGTTDTGTTGGQTVTMFDIKPGDCFSYADLEGGQEATLLDCNGPHEAEVYAETTMTDSAYPGDTAADAQAQEYCLAQFPGYVGVDYNSSSYELYYFYPTDTTWSQYNDRLISCIVYSQTAWSGLAQGTAK